MTLSLLIPFHYDFKPFVLSPHSTPNYCRLPDTNSDQTHFYYYTSVSLTLFFQGCEDKWDITLRERSYSADGDRTLQHCHVMGVEKRVVKHCGETAFFFQACTINNAISVNDTQERRKYKLRLSQQHYPATSRDARAKQHVGSTFLVFTFCMLGFFSCCKNTV